MRRGRRPQAPRRTRSRATAPRADRTRARLPIPERRRPPGAATTQQLDGAEERLEVLARPSVATDRMYGSPRSVRSPPGRNARRRRVARPDALRSPERSHPSQPCSRDREDDIAGRPRARTSAMPTAYAGGRPLGKCSGTRSRSSSPELRAPEAGATNRSHGVRRRAEHAFEPRAARRGPPRRHTFARVLERGSSIGIPEAPPRSDEARPSASASATSSCSPSPSGSAEEPRMSCRSCSRNGQRRDVEHEPHSASTRR